MCMSEKSDNNLKWFTRVAVTVAIFAMGWFVREWAIEQRKFNEKINERVAVLEVESAKLSGSRFTSVEWTSAKTILDERDVNMDKRITRVEDAIPAIRQSLERIEAKLEKGAAK